MPSADGSRFPTVNPATGAVIKIPAKTTVKLTAAKALLDSLN